MQTAKAWNKCGTGFPKFVSPDFGDTVSPNYFGVSGETGKRPFLRVSVSPARFPEAPFPQSAGKRPFSRFPLIIPYGGNRSLGKRLPLGTAAPGGLAA
jgi:hypothetical protein